MTQLQTDIPRDINFPLPGGGDSLRIAYARHLLSKSLTEEHAKKHGWSKGEDRGLKHIFSPIPSFLDDLKERDGLFSDDPNSSVFKGKICIVGAGVAGLLTALMLKIGGIYNFDVVEASDRVGGRLYTHWFSDKENPDSEHDYYDIGAMRIPEIKTMQSALDLIKYLKLDDKLVDYNYVEPTKEDIVPHTWWYKNEKPDCKKFDDAIASVIQSCTQAPRKAFEEYMRGNNDYYSTRAWLMLQADPKLTYEETAMSEASETSTGLFDQAFIETIFDYCDFAQARNVKWKRLEGGLSQVTDRMKELIEKSDWPVKGAPGIKVTTSRPVTVMSETADGSAISVTTTCPKGQSPSTTDYSAVFSTTAMAPLRRIDIEGLHLPDKILTGIRSLSYDRATKVAIKFASPWWTLVGGVSSTDLPISKVVYPSWNDGPDKPAVLMVSYSWAQDATRMGALVPDYTKTPPSKDDEVVSVCLNALVKLFSKADPKTMAANVPKPITLDFLRSQYVTHHAFAWSHDPWQGGAFALFGPGQFKDVYPDFHKVYCHGKFFMSGEALSTHHAWISGAVDSAYMSFVLFTTVYKLKEQMVRVKESNLVGARGKNPEEIDEFLLRWAAKLSEGVEVEGDQNRGREHWNYGPGEEKGGLDDDWCDCC
ncbi:FAD/NAD(P)-binding domain-containing protein [Neurospora hispaniola]|uniref:FAD/NAD(P)-binding domain-containing protein n=1 Tax=Neurospora hispaniola TaxID=588809 RepID=A0AAJ0MVN7_9PEZI|nr:FAD/NAD(P)-binding domain-containing protein [Neurospora hispaniola]